MTMSDLVGHLTDYIFYARDCSSLNAVTVLVKISVWFLRRFGCHNSYIPPWGYITCYVSR